MGKIKAATSSDTEKQNFFSKVYTRMEGGYNNFSKWISGIGIPLNKLNDYLESKGVPAFALVGSILLVIVLLIIFLLIFGLKSSMSVNFIIQDPNGLALQNVSVTFKDQTSGSSFSHDINSGDTLKLPLKISRTYKITAIKDGYPDKYFDQDINSENQTIRIIFDETVVPGTLILRVLDSETNKIIGNATAVAMYTLNGEDVNVSGAEDSQYNINLDVPQKKNITLVVSADKYQDTTIQNFQLNDAQVVQEVKLNVSTALFEGKSKVTFIVVDQANQPLSNATVNVYNLQGTLLDQGITINGRTLLAIDTGETITYSVTKDGYRTTTSDETKSYRILNEEETYTVVMPLGGTNLNVKVIGLADVVPISDAEVTLYTINGQKIDSNLTGYDGSVAFSGLEVDSNLYVVACKEDYFCANSLVSLKNVNETEIKLEKATVDNSAILYVFVVDGKNLPVTSARVRLYQVVDGLEVPYGSELLADMQGGVSIPLKIDTQYDVYAIVGDLNDSEYITISKTSENKLIFVINDASRLLTLDLLDAAGNNISDGHVTITTKDGTVLYDADVNADPVRFETKGYNDYIVDYTDVNGNKTTASMSATPDNLLKMVIKPKAIGNYPIVEFAGILNEKGEKVDYISINKDYFLLFDVTFPENVTQGGFHIRAGDDTETDSEDMTYGITGFESDSTRFKYSTTYNPEPIPGNQSLDTQNQGTEGEINKWLEMEWKDNTSVSSKQVKVRIKATELTSYKLKFNYRAWDVIDRSFYRDPKDDTLGLNFSNSSRQGLYAETKEVEVNLFDVPLDCTNDLCVSYEFVDSNLIRYEKQDFFGLRGDMYAVELNLFSEKNREIAIDADTASTLPIISLISSSDSLSFPTAFDLASPGELKLTNDKITLEGGVRQKVYFFFAAKDIGASYINFKYSGGGINTRTEKVSFNIFDRRELRVVFNPDVVLPYGNPLNIEVYDSATGTPIENALITISDDKGQFITSLKGSNVNGKKGKYYINNKFVVNKLSIVVSAHGYAPYTKELVVADDSILTGPSDLVLNLGESDISDSVTFKLKNTSDYVISNVGVGDIIWADPVDTLTVDVKGPIGIQKKGEGEFIATATVSTDSTFKVATGKIPIYGVFGNRQVARIINLRVIRGLQTNACLIIKPAKIDTYVGIQQDAENTIPITIQNNCDRTLIITPELKTIKSNSNNLLDIGLPQTTILSGEAQEYSIDIINRDDRKQVKTYNYEIIWRNQYYVVPNTVLNVSLLDLSKALWVAPPVIYVAISQLNAQQPGITYNRFVVKNIGNVPITNIQISKYPEVVSSNIGVTEFPREVSVLLPNKEIPIDLQFQVNINARTIDDLYYTITGTAAGVKDPITAKVTIYFIISSPNCIKSAPQKLDYTMNIGETKTRNITLTNQCAEPIMIRGIDKSDNTYLQTFGNNPLMLYPVSGSMMGSVIPIGGSATYALRLTANTYGGSPLMPITIIGQLANSQNWAKSDTILTSININSVNKDDTVDRQQTTTLDVPVCGKADEIRTLTFPTIVNGECTGQNGYCDAYQAGELILKKIDELSKRVQNISASYSNKVINSGCTVTASKGYCPVSTLGSMTSPPSEFTFYLQNDEISPELLQNILSKSSYSFKNYMVDASPFETMPTEVYGVLASGNKIMLSSGFRGCGRYKVTIDEIMAADYENLFPDRAYYFVLIEDYKETTQCEKKVENFLNYMPWDRKLNKNAPVSTWLTVFTGDENIGKGVAKAIFNDEARYAPTVSLGSKNNKLEIKPGPVTENPDALARIFFLDTSVVKEPKPETIDILINDKFAIEGKKKLPENVVTDATKVIGSFLSKQDLQDICVNEAGDSLLILKLISAGELKFTPGNDRPMAISANQECTDYNISSGISETIKINYSAPPNLKVFFKYNEAIYDNNLTIDLEKGRDANFSVCFGPTIPEISQFVGKDITITATSIYRATGKLGQQRQAIAKIKLTTCGVPPIKILEHTKNTIEVLLPNKKVTIPPDYTFYALIDWNKSYNTNDMETFCETLVKFNKENPEAAMFFDYKKAGCQLDTQKAESSAKMSKAVKNTGIYFGTCLGTCAACTAGADALWALTGIGVFKIGWDAAVNCGIGCGIPSASLFVNTATGMSLSQWMDKGISKLVGSDVKPTQAVDNFIGKIFGWVTGSFGNSGAAGAGIAGAGISAGTRMIKSTPLAKAEVTLYPGQIPNIQTIPAGGAAAGGAAAGGTAAGGTAAGGVAAGGAATGGAAVVAGNPAVTINSVPNLEPQLERFVGYANGTSTSYEFRSPPAGTAIGTDAEFRDVLRKLTPTANGGLRAPTVGLDEAFGQLSREEVDLFADYLGRGTYQLTPTLQARLAQFPNLAPPRAPSPNNLVTKLSSYNAQKFGLPTAGVPAGAGVTGGTPAGGTPAGGTPAGGATPNQLTTITEAEHTNMLNTIKDQQAIFDKSLKDIDAKLKQIGKESRWKPGSKKTIADLTKTKEGINAAKAKLTEAQKILSDRSLVFNDPTTPGQMIVEPEGETAIRNLANDATENVALRNAPGGWAKFGEFGAGLITGIVCASLGNFFASNVLSATGQTGLSNSVVLKDNYHFNKNALYMITLNENPDYVAPTGAGEKSEANKRAMYMLTVEKYTGNQLIPDDSRIDSCVIPGAPSLMGLPSSTTSAGAVTPGETTTPSTTTPTVTPTTTKSFAGILPVRSPYSDSYVISTYINKADYQGNCLEFARLAGTSMFNYQSNWNIAPNAWTVAASNQSVWTSVQGPLNYDNLIPGSILGIYIDGANQVYGLTANQYSHVILYVGNFNGRQHVVMDSGWTNGNQKSFYTTIEEYFSAHPTYHLREVILPRGTLDDAKKQTVTACLVNRNEVCSYS